MNLHKVIDWKFIYNFVYIMVDFYVTKRLNFGTIFHNVENYFNVKAVVTNC